MRSGILIAIVAAVLLAPLSASQHTLSSSTQLFCMVTQSNETIGACIASTIPLAMLGLLLSLCLVALVYILGNVLPVSGLKNWYQGELKETTKSVIIVVSVFSVVAILGGLSASLVSTSTSPSFSVSAIGDNIGGMYTAIIGTDTSGYLTPQINLAMNTFYGLFGLYDGLGLAKSFELEVYLPFPVVPVFTFGSLNSGVEENVYSTNLLCTTNTCSSIIDQAGTMVVMPTLIVLEMQKDLLYYIIVAGLGVLIPIGLVLRAVPFLRPIGGSFIAMGIGAALVYPSLLLMLNLPVSSYLTPIQAPQQTDLCSAAAYPSIPGVPTMLTNYVDQGICEAYNEVGSLLSGRTSSTSSTQSFLNGFAVGSLGSLTNIYGALNFVLSMQFIDVLVQFVLFVFDIIIGVVITSDIAGMLGGKVSFGVGRLKLV